MEKIGLACKLFGEKIGLDCKVFDGKLNVRARFLLTSFSCGFLKIRWAGGKLYNGKNGSGL